MGNGFYSAFWQRSTYYLDDDAIVERCPTPEEFPRRLRHRGGGPPVLLPGPKTGEHYDLFDYYFPLLDRGTTRHGLGSRGKPSLYRIFAALGEDDEAMLMFSRQYGLLGLGYYSVRPRPVTVEDALHGRRERLSDIRCHQDTFKSVMKMLAALDQGEASLLKDLSARLVYPSPTWPHCDPPEVWNSIEAPQSLDAAADIAAMIINAHLRGAWPSTVRSVDGTWSWLWQLRSLLDGLYTMLHLDLIGPGQWKVCPVCQTVFLSNQATYCSPRCQNNAKVKRYRMSQAKLEKSKNTVSKSRGRKGGKHQSK